MRGLLAELAQSQVEAITVVPVEVIPAQLDRECGRIRDLHGRMRRLSLRRPYMLGQFPDLPLRVFCQSNIEGPWPQY